VSPLTRKLLRDLWRMKGQALAIALVIATGVMMTVMMTGLVESLSETRRAYYERYRLADIVAPVVRAPDRLAEAAARIDGVAAVQTRITGGALIDMPGRAVPIQAQALSLPDRGAARLNDIHLTAGQGLARAGDDDILLLQSFATAWGLGPGDTLSVTMNGARRELTVVGLAQSPEFLFTAAPGEMIADDSRYGVFWMRHGALAAVQDQQGAFNQVLVGLTRDADAEAVKDALDRLLDPYGATGAHGRDGQFSDIVITQEIAGLRSTAASVPPIFLAVAAFLLNIVVGRLVQAEREEIGLMKAFGYTDTEVSLHYLRLVLAIAVIGAALGCLFGIYAGYGMTDLYLKFFKFPFLVFRLDPASFVIGVGASILAASAGGMLVLRRVFALAPAEAMRPPAPADYSRTGRVGQAVLNLVDQPTRMVIRRLTRQPVRMAGSVIGIACGMALSSAMLTIFAAFDVTIENGFAVADRSHALVGFNRAVSEDTILALKRRPGVMRAEPMRQVPVILSNGRHEHRGAITGLPEGATLIRALSAELAEIEMRRDGLIVSQVLADKLHLAPGDTLRVDVREGRQPVLDLTVAAVATGFSGTPVYMELEALNRALDEPGRVSAAALLVDGAQAEALYAWLKDQPAVAGVAIKNEMRAALERMMDEGAGQTRFILGALAFVLTFGIVYNTARIALAERGRDLASLRVIGFTRGEAAYVLLGELAVVTLVAVPLGAALGHGVTQLLAAAYSSELYVIPALFAPAAEGQAALVVLSAALASGLLVKRDLDRADLVETLKTRE